MYITCNTRKNFALQTYVIMESSDEEEGGGKRELHNEVFIILLVKSGTQLCIFSTV